MKYSVPMVGGASDRKTRLTLLGMNGNRETQIVVDVKAFTNNYKKLTEYDFFVELISYVFYALDNTTFDSTTSIVKTYEAETGILTITGIYRRIYERADMYAKVKVYMIS